jgi:uncharacterized membrane protein
MTPRVGLAAVGLLVLAALVAAPIAGWPRVVRLPAVLVPGIALALLTVRPWKRPALTLERLHHWDPPTRQLLAGACATGALLLWIVLTRFYSGGINAVDFTVYFDRPCYQTVQGRPLFVETADNPGFSYRSQLAVHAFWNLVPICSLYWLYATPYWLLVLSIVAVMAGAIYIFRIGRLLGWSSLLASAAALSLVLNDNTARTLNYGFHAEVLYVWFVPWMIHAALRHSRLEFVAATIACVTVKEDAVLPLVAVACGLVLNGSAEPDWRGRLLFLFLPIALAVGNLLAYFKLVLPVLTPDGAPTYGGFWSHYGPTTGAAALAMLRQPLRLARDTLTSGLFPIVLPPHGFLPLAGWRWSVGILPIVVLYSAAAIPQIRAFGIYYAIVLVPFLVLAAATGALWLARKFVVGEPRAHAWAACAVLLAALLAGATDRGYTLRPWSDQIAAVPEALATLSAEQVVLVQSGLYPFSGYESRIKLLTPETLADPAHAGAAVLLARAINGYPFTREQIAQLASSPGARDLDGGLTVARVGIGR